MSAYVTKTEVEPFTMIPGFAANAYRANMATMDGNGVEIATDYAKKTDLTASSPSFTRLSGPGVYVRVQTFSSPAVLKVVAFSASPRDAHVSTDL